MLESKDFKRRADTLLMLFVLIILSAASFEGFFVKWNFNDDDQRYSIQRLLDESADRPFVYRQLVPSIATGLCQALPDQYREKLRANLEKHNFLSEDFRRTNIQSEYIIEYYLIYALSLLSLILSALLLRRLCSEFVCNPIAATLGAMLFVLLFPLLESGGGYFYDFTERL